jgi:hypothetical protein
MTCVYCQGQGSVPNPILMGRTLPCVNCHSTGKVCHLCRRPKVGDDACECPPFDADTSKGRKCI